MLRRRGRTAVTVLLVVAGTLVTADFVRGLNQPAPQQVSAVQASLTPQPTPSPSVSSPVTVPLGVVAATPTAGAFPPIGAGTFVYSATNGSALGTAGNVRTFRVAVENGSLQNVETVAAEIDRILGDSRSWTASGDVRLQRVAQGGEFTIFVATETTADQMCRKDNPQPSRKINSCRLASGKVVISLSSWRTGAPDFRVAVDAYHGYAINHEVGHQLGHGDERCPAPGAPAPVMQQQDLGLFGCTANPWPFVGGKRYVGPPGSYVPGGR